MKKYSKFFNFVASLTFASIILYAAIYAEELKELPVVFRTIVIVLVAALQLKLDNVYDFASEVNKNYQLSQKNKQLQNDSSRTSQELSELRTLIVTFLEHSEIFREKVKNHLRLNEDYLCIVKSSEGLSSVYNFITDDKQLPFTRVLSEIPGSIRPFEYMALFLIPIRSIPKLKSMSIRNYIDSVIIPQVKKERKKYINRVPERVAREADKFSYKYIAFFLRKEKIAHDVQNRKFNRMFNAFIVNEQIGGDFKNIKSGLVEVVKTKEIFQLINWTAFAKLNAEQNELIEYYKQKINIALVEREIITLSDLTQIDADEFSEIIWPIVYRKSTKIKVKNLSKKVIAGANNTIDVLRKNGVNF